MNSASENDLQKAIDDIARAGGGQSASTLEDAAAVAGGGSDADTEAETDATNDNTETSPYIETNGQVPPADPVAAMPEVETTMPQETVETQPVAAPVEEPQITQQPVMPEMTIPTPTTMSAPMMGMNEPMIGSVHEKMDARTVRDKAIDDLKPMIGTVDLTPILEKVSLLPETKFKIYQEIINTTRDKDVLGPAYETAKEIPGDTARAEALLYLVEVVDKLS